MLLNFIQTMMSVETKIIIAVLFMKSYTDAQAIEVHEPMIELINSCFMDRLKIVTTTLELFDHFDQISNSDPIPVIIINENFESNEPQHLLLFLGTFVLPANSKESFEAILLAAKSSPWWNVNALFIILGNPQERCTSALEVLSETWKMHLQSVLFLCDQHEEGVMLYTFNPHANRAPYPWKEVGFLKKRDDPWTLFRQPYIAGPEKCGSLDFHRTKFIDVCKAGSRHKCATWEEVGADREPHRMTFN